MPGSALIDVRLGPGLLLRYHPVLLRHHPVRLSYHCHPVLLLLSHHLLLLCLLLSHHPSLLPRAILLLLIIIMCRLWPHHFVPPVTELAPRLTCLSIDELESVQL